MNEYVETKEILRGLRQRIRLARDDLQGRFPPVVLSKLWKAEQNIARAEELLSIEEAKKRAESGFYGPLSES